MAKGQGKLRTLNARLCPTWAALGAFVLLVFLALGSVHDHADDAPGTTAIHCPVAAGPVVHGGSAQDVRLPVSDAVVRPAAAPCLAPESRRPLHSDRARAPPTRAV